MNSMRRIVALLMAVVLTAFAVPAVADSGDKYRVNMPVAPVATGVQFNMTITNKAGFDTLKSFTITAPAGVFITGVASGSSNIPGGKITPPNPLTSGGTISVSNIAIYNNQSGTLKITATFPASCSAQTLTWTSTAMGGFFVSNEVFSLDSSSNLNTTISAGSCNYTFVTDTPAVNAGASTTMIAKVTNQGPASAPAITSFVLTAPAGLNITGATGTGGTVSVTSSAVTVSGVSVAGGANYPVNVTVAPAASCTGTPAASWSSSVTPATFTLSGGNPTTSITAQACSLSISAASSAVVGTAFAVTVNLTGGPGNAQVTLTPTGCPAPVLSAPPLTANAVGGVATFNLTFTGTGTCSVAATATNYTPTNNPRIFSVYAIPAVGCTNLVMSPGNDGTVDPDLASVANPNGSAGQWGLRRGNNSDGSGCNAANATFTLDTTNKIATLTYDKAAGGSAGVFKYTIVWPEVAVDQSGPTTSWTDFRPKVSWGIPSPNPNTDDFVPALTCADDDLSQGESLLPTIPNVAPFNALSPSTYPQYQPGQLARMCIAQHAWTSNMRLGGIIQVIYWDKVVDEGDGHVTGP